MLDFNYYFKKKYFLIFGVFLLIFIILISNIFFKKSNNPKEWVIKNNISVYKATDGLSYYDIIGQQNFEMDTVFINDGRYVGKYFKNYFEENNQIKLRFSQKLKKDNIPDIFIFEKLENNEPYVYIFVDEDWKNQIKETNIIYGSKYQNIKKFTYTELEKGIYYEKIKDDIERFSDNYKIHYSGILVGKITKEDIEKNNFDNAIFVRFV